MASEPAPSDGEFSHILELECLSADEGLPEFGFPATDSSEDGPEHSEASKDTELRPGFLDSFRPTSRKGLWKRIVRSGKESEASPPPQSRVYRQSFGLETSSSSISPPC